MRVRTAGAWLIATLALLAAGAPPTSANPIIDFTDGRAEPVIGTVTYGYDFSVLSPVQVTGLGVFESFARLLGASHEVGLWDSTGTLLASATVDGTDTIVASTDALGQWRTVNIAPIDLGVGQYFVGAHYVVSDDDVLVLATSNTLPGISYGSARYLFGSSLAMPTNTFPTSLVGPVVLSSPVPEPATLILVGSGLFGLAARRRRAS